MCLNLDQRRCRVRRPHRYCAILVTHVKDSVIWILRHSSWRTLACWMLGYNLAGRRIRVSKKATVLNASQEKMIGQKLKVCGFDIFAKTMYLNASMVVDICMLFLGDGKILVIMQPFGVTNRLVQVQLTT